MLDSKLYDKIDLEVYKEIYSEAKVKFDETVTRSEIISDRSIKLFLLLVALSGWASTSFIGMSQKWYCAIVLYIFLWAFAAYKTYHNLKGRKSAFKGTMPEAVYASADALLDPSHDQLKVFFFHQIERYQYKIDRVEAINVQRAKAFRLCLGLSIILLLLTASIYALKTFG